MALYNEESRSIFYGIVLIVVSMIFLLSSLGVFWKSTYIIDDRLDLVIAFIFLLFGLAFVFSGSAKAK